MEINKAKTTIKSKQLFHRLNESQLESLVYLAQPKELSPNEAIYTRGESSNGKFCLILSGRTQVVAQDGHIVKALGSGDVPGEIALFAPQRKRTVTVITTEATEILEWDIYRVQENIPGVRETLFKLMWKNMNTYYEE